MKSNKVLVTGGAGFIGSHVSELLAEKGLEVTVFDNFRSGDKKNLAATNAEVIEGDVRKLPQLMAAAKGMDAIYHLAVEPLTIGLENPFLMEEVNALGTLNALHAAKTAGVKRFNYVSSSEVYGSALRIPMGETHPRNPCTAYSASKMAGEAYAMAYQKTYGLNYSIIRPFNAYGPRQRTDSYCAVIPRFIAQAKTGTPLTIFGDGKQTRDFSFIKDTARGIVLAGESLKTLNDSVNIGSGKETSINELAETLNSVMNKHTKTIHLPPRAGDVQRHCADVTKAWRLLKFKLEYDLRGGLEKLLEAEKP